MSEKLVFLYAGTKDPSTHYNYYNDADISAFISGQAGVNEFVITPGNHVYFPLGTTLANLEGYVSALINDMLDIAEIVERTTQKNVWFGTPHIPVPTSTMTLSQYSTGANSHAKLVCKFIDIVKARYNDRFSNAFNARVRGFYMNHEHLSTLPYDPGQVALNYADLTAHPEVAMFDVISQHVQITLARSFIWVPFYGVGAYYMTIIKDIGYVANRTNIFNIVFMQPQYYFTNSSNIKNNLAAIHESMRLNRVVYRKNASGAYPEVCSKTSSTLIGCQMEIDNDYIDKMEKVEDVDYPGEGRNLANFADRYAAYTSAFLDYSGNRPISFYCGDKLEHFASITAETVKFY